MDLLGNPFHLLQAHARDNRQRIMELYAERSLVIDAGDCRQARSELINPRKRLAAEVAWLPGVGPQQSRQLLFLVENDVAALLDVSVPYAAKANLLAAGLARLSNHNPERVAAWVLDLAWAFEAVQASHLSTIINADRVASGFPEMSDLSVLEDEIGERRRYYQQVIRNALNALPSQALVETVTLTVRIATINGRKHGPVLVDGMVDAYEIKIQGSMDSELAKIKKQMAAMRANVSGNSYGRRKNSTSALNLNALQRLIRHWDELAQPIQVSTMSRGLDHDASFGVANLVRELAFELTQQHGDLNASKQLIRLVEDVFAEVGKIAELAEEDLTRFARVILDRGWEKMKQEQYQAAIADFDEALRLDPNSAIAFSSRGIAKSSLNQHRNAITDFDQALRLDPEVGQGQIYVARGRTYARLEQFGHAINDYNQALRFMPDATEVYWERGVAQSELGRFYDAIEDFDRVLWQNPDFANGYMLRGLAKERLGDHYGARSDYNQAVQLDPGLARHFSRY